MNISNMVLINTTQVGDNIMKNRIIVILSFVYTFLLLVMVINIFSFGYHVDTKYYTGIVFYYLLAFCAIVYVYKSRDNKMLLLVSILLFFLSPLILIFIPAFAIFSLSFVKGFTSKTKIATRTILVLGSLIFILYTTMLVFLDKPISYDKLFSPDKEKVVVSRYFGAPTVSQLDIQLRQSFFNNTVTISRVLYSTGAGDQIAVEWLDNNTIIVNGEIIDVYLTL